jgi:CheY-like chemotaxis protein
VEPSYVLIVDDDPDAREVLTDIVESLGLEARVAEDGSTALKAVNQTLPTLILLDLMMPRMDGFTMLSRLRSTPRTRAIPVIVVTACGNDGRRTLMLPGVIDVVPKGSFTVQFMTQIISRTLMATGAVASGKAFLAEKEDKPQPQGGSPTTLR